MNAHAFTGQNDYNVDISGNLVGSACVIDIPEPIDLGSSIVTSQLTFSSEQPSSNQSQLPTVTVTQCQPDQQFSVHILGTADEDDTGVLKNSTDEGAAHYVGVGVWEMQGGYHLLKPNVSTSVAHTADDSGTTSFQLVFSAVRTSAANEPTAGTISTMGQIKIDFL
jgi:type 1 fimbria pilin